MVRITRDQPHLRLVTEDFDRCNSCNATAASPLGASVRPHSISLTDDGDNPIRLPISANVMPLPRRSETREDQVTSVICGGSLRATVGSCLRLPVTGLRDNRTMPRPPEMPKDLNTPGKRIRWWRTFRGIKRPELAKRVGYSYSGLGDLENGHSNASEKLHLIAAELRLNPHYVETGAGEPEATHPQEPPPPPDEWPFPGVPRSKLKKLNRIERSYLETKLLEAISEIESERRNKTG